MPSIQEIENLINSSLSDLAAVGVKWDKEVSPSQQPDLYGAEGILDSLSLIHLVVRIEEEVLKTYSQKISLVDEKALSRTNSPFGNISTLAKFVAERMEKNG